MKSTTLFALFVLSVFTSYLPCAQSVVLDTDGNWVLNGGIYHIVPVVGGKGGGMDRAATGNESCPLTVVQSRRDHSKGFPLFISSPYRILFVGEGLILWLEFVVAAPCVPPPSWWTVVNGLPEGSAVKLTHDLKMTSNGWFHIEKVSPENNYKLVFCFIDGGKCGDIGINIDDKGNRRLVLTETDNDPLLVQFEKVGDYPLPEEALTVKNHVLSPNREVV